MNDQPTNVSKLRPLPRHPVALLMVGAMLGGGCYQSVSAGLGGGRTNKEPSQGNAGVIAAGGAYDIGPARVGVGFIPLGPGFAYGPEARTEICLRSRKPEKTITGVLLPNCSADLIRDTLNIRVGWLPRSWFADSPDEAPDLFGYKSGLSINLGIGRDYRAPYPSSVIKTVQYFNFSAGIFYTQRWFEGRNSDWIAGIYGEASLRLDYLELIGGAATRQPH